MKRAEKAYPVPKPTGGKLIRELISSLRSPQIGLKLPPIKGSHILIAVSGGPDSVALAVLLAKYGRRVGSPKQMTIVHVNHGWRGAESDADEKFTRDLARRLKVGFRAFRMDQPSLAQTGPSWEDHARTRRKQIYRKLTSKKGSFLLTAHHADDLAETLLWRLFTGGAETHGGGILLRDGAELRPLLRIRKQELEAFLREEGESWREDRTNREGRFLRSRMRLELLPVIEELFPRAIEHLTRLGLQAQTQTQPRPELGRLSELFGIWGLRLRRTHWEAVTARLSPSAALRSEVQLPGGWSLVNDRKLSKSKRKPRPRAGA